MMTSNSTTLTRPLGYKVSDGGKLSVMIGGYNRTPQGLDDRGEFEVELCALGDPRNLYTPRIKAFPETFAAVRDFDAIGGVDALSCANIDIFDELIELLENLGLARF